jgi:hypothetical protein
VADRWRRRYYAARGRLEQAGIKLLPDDRNGAETYVRLRSEWDRHIMALAPAMAYSIEEIDPIGTRPQKTEERPAFRERLRSVI